MSQAGHIDRLIAHRAPFRFVDALVRVDPEAGELLLDLARDDPRLHQGRLAPLLLVEALAQATAAFNRAQERGDTPEVGVLVSIDQARFYAAAHGGDRVALHVRAGQTLGPMARFRCAARVAERLLVEAELTVRRGSDILGEPAPTAGAQAEERHES